MILRKLFLLVLTLHCVTSMTAQKNTRAIESTIISFFNGLSLLDDDTLHYYTTPDFQLLENGHVWNLDTLIAKVMPRKKLNIQRVNRFSFIRTEQSNDIAWVSYHNSAEFSSDEKRQTVKWTESAVLVKQDERWKIQLLHSTKIPW